MDVALAALVFAPALALGSFLNVVVARLPEKRSLLRPRSACLACGHEIAWHDNVPLVSYLVLRGRCRDCGARISFRYFAVELATALLVAACFVHFGLSGEALVAALFVAVLVALSAIDVETRLLPDRIVLPATGLVLAGQAILDPSHTPELVLSALGAAFFLFAAVVAYPAGMGMGDVKLTLLLGVMLGRYVGVALMAGMFASLGLSIVLFAKHGLKARKMKIPFGPFLAFGGVLALFWGEPILHAYLGSI